MAAGMRVVERYGGSQTGALLALFEEMLDERRALAAQHAATLAAAAAAKKSGGAGAEGGAKAKAAAAAAKAFGISHQVCRGQQAAQLGEQLAHNLQSRALFPSF